MTLFVDSSALVKRYSLEHGTPLVLELMAGDREWVGSAVTLVESQIALCRAGIARADPRHENLLRDWQRFRIIPVDDGCLTLARQIGCEHSLRTLDSLHVAAADRLPRPVTFLTFDHRQAVAARELGFDVVGAAGEV